MVEAIPSGFARFRHHSNPKVDLCCDSTVEPKNSVLKGRYSEYVPVTSTNANMIRPLLIPILFVADALMRGLIRL